MPNHASIITINDAEITKRRLRAMKERINNPDRAWPRVGRYLSITTNKQFATKGAYLGTPWAPLQPDYLLWKVANGYPRATLVMRGDLKQSLTGRPMGIERYNGKSAVFGSGDRKFIWHQKGTKRNGRQVNPPRPMIVLTPTVRAEITDIMRRYIRGRGPGVY